MILKPTAAPLLLFSALCISCTTSVRTESDQAKNSDDVKSDIRSLQGSWWREASDTSATFFIAGDSLYYTDDQKSPYLITIANNIFQLSQDDVSLSFAIKKMTADSLVFYDAALGENIKFIRKN